jgi:SAM-dependent methyltransferase
MIMHSVFSERQARVDLAHAIRGGQLDRAAQTLKTLLQQQPRDPALHHTAAELSLRHGNRVGAVQGFGKALELASGNPAHEQAAAIATSAARYLGQLLGSYALDGRKVLSREALTLLMRRPDVDPQAIATAALPVWRETPPWQALFAMEPAEATEILLGRAGEEARKDPLTLALLERAVLTDMAAERLLLAFADALSRNPDCEAAQDQPFRSALAVQLWLTGQTRDGDEADPATGAFWRKVREWRQQERELASKLPDYAPAHDADDPVRQQYEQFPYPRWIGFTVPQAGSRRAFLKRTLPGRDWSGPLDVLIAGCGTGRHALMAALGYGATTKLTAIDISLASLGYAERKRREYGVENLGLARCDLTRLEALPETLRPAQGYDVIESVGVLHHLPDPEAGLASLARQLKPDGLMQLGLYRRAGRTHVAMARREIAELGLEAGDDEAIRAYRDRIINDPIHPLHERLALNRDFYSLEGCRDLLFHAREQDTDLPAIGDMLARQGLTFAGMQMPDGALQAFVGKHGADKLQDATSWQAFEAARPELFDAMYRFWVTKT